MMQMHLMNGAYISGVSAIVLTAPFSAHMTTCQGQQAWLEAQHKLHKVLLRFRSMKPSTCQEQEQSRTHLCRCIEHDLNFGNHLALQHGLEYAIQECLSSSL